MFIHCATQGRPINTTHFATHISVHSPLGQRSGGVWVGGPSLRTPPHPPHPRSTNPVRCWQLPPEGLLGRRERFSKQGANHFSRCDTSCFVEVTWHKPCASSRTAMDTTNIRKQLWNNRRPQDPDKQLPSGRPVSFLAALSGPTFPWIPCL